MNIFLAEDNASDSYLIREALTSVGLTFTLFEQPDGEAAVHALAGLSQADGHLDLILLDLNLPKISGHEILRRLKGWTNLAHVPVIVLTSSNSPRDRNETAAQGIAHYFRKPVDINEFFTLGDIVKSVLARQNGASSGS